MTVDWTAAPQDEAALRAAFAAAPTAPYRPITAWWWSGEKLELQRLQWQLEQIAALGCGGVAITGLAFFGPSGGSVADDPPGFSDEWLALYRSILERCRELGLGAVSWSMFAGGLPLDAPESLRRHPEYRGELPRTRDGVAVQPFGYDFGSRAAVEALTAPGTVNARHLDAIDGFLGDPIVLMFEDEIPGFPRWSPTFATEFKDRKGYDFPIEAFDQDVGPRTPAVRCDLFDVAAARVEEAYTGVVADWVAKHGLLAGYDQMSRRGTPLLSSHYYMDPFRTMGWANAPGTDQMGDARFHLSLADLDGHSRVWLEGFHSHGWGMTLEHQARLLFEWGREGANLFLPHGMYYAGRAFWWEWAPPEMGWKQPYARHYPAFAEAMGRWLTVLSSGRHVPEVAVLYPLSTVQADTTGHLEWGQWALAAEEAWLDVFGTHGAPSGMEPERAARPSVLADAYYDRVAVDERRVDAFGDLPIVVPACKVLKTATVERLIAHAEAGHVVVLVEPLPDWSAEVGREDPQFAALAARLADVAVVVPSAAEVVAALPPPRVDGLKSQWRRVGDLDVVVLTGTGRARLRGMADRAPERWDVQTGTVEPLPATVDGDDLLVDVEGRGTVVALPLGTPTAPAPAADRRAVELPEVWEVEYLPWGENRWGDYRLPANEGTPPVERRTFAWREGDDPAWRAAPVVPEDVQWPLVDRGFEERMGQARGRPLPHDRKLPDGWHEVVSTYGPKAVVDGKRLAEYSERLGVEDLLLTTPIGLKGWVEPVKVDLGEQGGTVVSHGFVPEAADTHLVVEGSGVLSVWLDGERLIEAVEGGVLSLPVSVEAGWHEVRIEVVPRHGVPGHLEGYRALPQTRLAWAFMAPYRRPALAVWGGPVMHPDYKGAQNGRRFRRRIVIPERARVALTWSTDAPVTVEAPEVLEPGEHWIECFVDGAMVVPVGFMAEVTLTLDSGAVVSLVTDDRWETCAPGEPWQRPIAVGMVGALGHAGDDPDFGEPERRNPLLDVAWLEGGGATATHVDTIWSDSPDAPPPSWFCFTAPPGAVSMTLPVVGDVAAWLDGEPVEADLADGVLPLREHARVALRVQAPAGYRGAACFTEHPVLTLGPGTMRLGRSWHRSGLDCFSGVLLHRATVQASAGPAVLDLGEVAGTVAVTVNGEPAGTLTYGPWRLPVTLREGDNVIELEVANTLGPMVARGVPTPFGPEEQRFGGLLSVPRLLV